MKKKLVEKYLGEAKEMTPSEFGPKLEAEIKKIFPKSFVRVSSDKNLGTSFWITFALGKSKSEWTNGIVENDPLLHKLMLAYNQFDMDKDEWLMDKITLEKPTVGGSMKIRPKEGSMYAFDRIKLPLRKKTATPEKMFKSLVDYFKKVKKILMDNKEKLTDRDYELNKNKL